MTKTGVSLLLAAAAALAALPAQADPLPGFSGPVDTAFPRALTTEVGAEDDWRLERNGVSSGANGAFELKLDLGRDLRLELGPKRFRPKRYLGTGAELNCRLKGCLPKGGLAATLTITLP